MGGSTHPSNCDEPKITCQRAAKEIGSNFTYHNWASGKLEQPAVTCLGRGQTANGTLKQSTITCLSRWLLASGLLQWPTFTCLGRRRLPSGLLGWPAVTCLGRWLRAAANWLNVANLTQTSFRRIFDHSVFSRAAGHGRWGHVELVEMAVLKPRWAVHARAG